MRKLTTNAVQESRQKCWHRRGIPPPQSSEFLQLHDFIGFNGAPGEIRTPGLLIRSQSLYPAELRAHFGSERTFVRLSRIQGWRNPR